jgi:hypothetical protein
MSNLRYVPLNFRKNLYLVASKVYDANKVLRDKGSPRAMLKNSDLVLLLIVLREHLKSAMLVRPYNPSFRVKSFSASDSLKFS